MSRWSALLFCVSAFGASVWGMPDSTAHLMISDSSGTRWAAVRVTLAESLQVTDLGEQHVQSSTWAGLLAYGDL
ncbi:MAG TPA: hypothetical protein VLM37_10000, partial [Fibrobacteraceae bacterium]|nr:hypothetical protein [Fibrobacteraceae bacterium]